MTAELTRSRSGPPAVYGSAAASHVEPSHSIYGSTLPALTDPVTGMTLPSYTPAGTVEDPYDVGAVYRTCVEEDVFGRDTGTPTTPGWLWALLAALGVYLAVKR